MEGRRRRCGSEKVFGLFGLILGVIAVSGCQNLEADAIEAVKTHVRSGSNDPESVQFSNVRARAFENENSKGAIVCGSVNLTNSLGGYVGFKQFNGAYSTTQGVTSQIFNLSDGDPMNAYYWAFCDGLGNPRDGVEAAERVQKIPGEFREKLQSRGY